MFEFFQEERKRLEANVVKHLQYSRHRTESSIQSLNIHNNTFLQMREEDDTEGLENLPKVPQ